jgi:hypothetical protein
MSFRRAKDQLAHISPKAKAGRRLDASFKGLKDASEEE